MTYIRFANEYKSDILSGKKNATVRVCGEHEAEAGKIHDLLDEDDQKFGMAYVPAITTTNAADALGIIERLDCDHGAENTEELIASLRRFYGPDVSVTTLVDIIPFKTFSTPDV